MKYLLTLILLSTLVSCGSSSKSDSKTQVAEDIPFNWLNNDDFKPVKEIEYDEGDDHYTGNIEDQDAISVETMAKIPPAKLQELVEEEDPISGPISLCYQKNFVAAFNKFDRAYKQLKNNAAYWNQVGTCYYLQGESRKALLYYNKARDLVKDYAPAINNIGLIHYRNGEVGKALSAFKTAYEVSKFSVTPSFNLAMMYLQFGFVEKAEPLLVALYKKNAGDNDVLNALAHMYMMKNDYSKAVSAFSHLSGDVMRIPAVSISLSYALYKTGQKDKAMTVLAQTQAQLTPSDVAYFSQVSSVVKGGK